MGETAVAPEAAEEDCGRDAAMTSRPVVAWMRANGIHQDAPDDAELRVDEQAGTITVEQFYSTTDGETGIHGQRVMTHLVTVPLLAPPPPGLLAAYQYTVAKLHRERNAAEAIRHETADRIAAHITEEAARTVRDAELAGNEGMVMFGHGLWSAATWHVWDAMGWPRPATASMADSAERPGSVGSPSISAGEDAGRSR